ncbi:MAG: 4a-hydroxytetrahydrobiopterin dehydratase [Gammaproteobacteria bacterium]
MTDIFISYRRTNSFEVERIHEKLANRFPSASIFLDRDDIKPGEQFPLRIREAAGAAHVMLVVVGRDWASVQDPTTLKRRIELREDWVRQEVEIGLAARKPVIPVLLEGGEVPTSAQLPKSLRSLSTYNAVKLTHEHFNEGAERLIEALSAHLGEARARKLMSGGGDKYPTAARYLPVPLDAAQLGRITEELPQWKVAETTLEDDSRFAPGYTRIELVREFRFASFIQAITFMYQAASSIDDFGHHPRWENVFRTVTVRLSTFDIGHRPSERDQVCARMIERLYNKFSEANPP